MVDYPARPELYAPPPSATRPLPYIPVWQLGDDTPWSMATPNPNVNIPSFPNINMPSMGDSAPVRAGVDSMIEPYRNIPNLLVSMFGGPSLSPRPEPAAPAGPAPFNFDIPAGAPIPQISAGVGGGGRFTPALLPDAPQSTVDPALAAREAHAGERSARIMDLIAQAQAGAQSTNPWEKNVWQRILAIVPSLAGAEPGRVGAAGAEVLQGWNQQHQTMLDRNLELAFLGEEETSRAAEAGFARQTGEHQVGETNLERTYNRDVGNVQLRNQAEQFNVGESNQNSRAAASVQAQIALANQEMANRERQMALGFVLPGGGPAALRAFGQTTQSLGPQIQREAVQAQARRGLESIIQGTIALAGNDKNTQINRVHMEMERLAGMTLARPPRNTQAEPSGLARYYINQGVPLDNLDVINSFPGFADAE